MYIKKINKKKIKYLLKIISQKILQINSIKIFILWGKIIIYQERYINKLILIKFKNIKSKYYYINEYKKNKTREKNDVPIHIILIIKKKYNHLNINILINKNISIIEEFLNIYDNNKYFNYNLDILIKKKTKTKFFRLIKINKKIKLNIKENIKLNTKSKLNKFIFFLKFKNINLYSNILLKKKSILKINSISLIKKKYILKYKNNIIHNSHNIYSYQKHHNIILEPGIIDFSGWIKILKKSFNSKAIVKNNNLCICKKSIINSSPKLSIWNKNAKCKHSVKINYLNKKEIFYLLTRGIKYYNIKNILILNFIKKIFKKIKNIYIYNKILYKYIKNIK